VAAVKKKKNTIVILTDHYSQRYRERVGNAPPAAQRAWLAQSLRRRKAKRSGNRYIVPLISSKHSAVLAREDEAWIAITIK